MTNEQEKHYSSSEETTGGLTREDLLRRALAGGVLIGAGGLTAGGVASASTRASAAAPKPKRGGTARVGSAGGGAKDSLDAHNPVTKPDEARVVQLFEALAKFDENFQIQMLLAEEITPESPRVWTIRLKPGLTFHNGKDVTADDVIFSLRRIINPKIPTFGGAGLSSLDPKRMTKLDKRTARLRLNRPDVTILDQLAQYFNGIVPAGYDPKTPVGTGPFKFKSFTPAQQSTVVRNENYWQTGLPYLDAVTIIDFPDDTARVNALLGGQVEAIDSLPLGQIPVIQARKDLRVLEHRKSGQWLPFTLRIDEAPFSDNRVRQAMRLLADRQQIVNQALAGHGRVANDLFSPFDPCFNSALPQRQQDLDMAKSLLKQAGQEGLTVTLQTSEVAAGLVEAAQVLAEQAKGAGVTINVNKVDSGVFYGDNYLKWLFAQDFWGTRNYLTQVAAGMLPTSPFNETHWPPQGSNYIQLFNQARATVDQKKRCDIIHEMQKMEYEQGGLIIWGYNNLVDAHSAKITGLKEDSGTLPLNRYGFGHVSFV